MLLSAPIDFMDELEDESDVCSCAYFVTNRKGERNLILIKKDDTSSTSSSRRVSRDVGFSYSGYAGSPGAFVGSPSVSRPKSGSVGAYYNAVCFTVKPKRKKKM